MSESSVQLDQHTRDHLQEILLRKEFQPRGDAPSWYDKLWDHASEWIHAQLKEVIDRLQGWDIRPDSDFWLVRWLSDLGNWLAGFAEYLLIFLKYLGYGLAIGVVVAVFYFIYRHLGFRVFPSGAQNVLDFDRKEEEVAYLSPFECLSKGEARLALVRLRDLLRSHLGSSFANYRSLTDYELRRKLDANTEVAQFFGEVSTKFESVFFAGNGLLDRDMQRLCQHYAVLEEQRKL